jgi:DNA-binding NarL/FixJ family response regulator
MTIRVLIADDHVLVAQGLRALIDTQADMTVIAIAANGREAVRLARELQPDIVLMDNAMPSLNGTEATRLIAANCAKTQVIMLSMHSDSVHVYRALQAGAAGYIAKSALAEELVVAIHAVHSGRRYLSKALAQTLVDTVAAGTPQDLLSLLSSRERQVLQLLAEGSSVVEISRRLSLSRKTVETYRARMMEKLRLDSAAALIKFAIREGVASLE